MPTPQAQHDLRLRKHLDGSVCPAQWPDGIHLRPFTSNDAPLLYSLLTSVFDDGSDGPFDVWWPKISADAEFDPALCFMAYGADGTLSASALCWKTAFVKDLAVFPDARRRGLGRALILHAFAAFQARGAPHVDLKTNLILNAGAVRLYQSLGMVEVDWDG